MLDSYPNLWKFVPRLAEGELLNVYNQIWFKHNPPGVPTPSTEGAKLIDTKKTPRNSASTPLLRG